MSYLRVPILASSGVAALLSGLLYFKQKYTIFCSLVGIWLMVIVKSYTPGLSLQTLERTYPGPRSSPLPTMRNCLSLPRTANP
jgi:hypothetical protein